MTDTKDKKSTSILSRTVKNIKKSRKTKNFIRVERKENLKKRGKYRKKNEEKSGLMYIGHLPPGFYEDELLKYFSQFGKVTNVRLERSKKTGRSKGYAFVEFQSPEVAKIAAETMNNYILFNRILKAEYVTRKYNRKLFWKIKPIKAREFQNLENEVPVVNKICSSEKEKKHLRGRITRLDEMIQRLKEKGIDYNYKPAIRREIAYSTCTDGKYVRIDSDIPVLEIDESDKEIEFMTPPNVIKKKLLVSKAQKSPLKTPNTRKQGKVKKEKKEKINKKLLQNANKSEIQKGSLVKQEHIPKEKSEFQMKKATPEIKKRNNKKQNPHISQKLKSLSQGEESKKQRKPRKGKKN